jgi:predicted DNA-binding transcriptional regulator AlpA
MSISNQHAVAILSPGDELSELLDDLELSRIVRKSVPTLRRYRKLGVGPQYLRIGRRVRYQKQAVIAWLALCASGGPQPKRAA